MRGFLNSLFAYRHFIVAHFPSAPERLFGSVFFAPVLIKLGKLFVNGDIPVCPQTVKQADLVRRIDVAAGAIADIEPVLLYSSENGNDPVL